MIPLGMPPLVSKNPVFESDSTLNLIARDDWRDTGILEISIANRGPGELRVFPSPTPDLFLNAELVTCRGQRFSPARADQVGTPAIPGEADLECIPERGQ